MGSMPPVRRWAVKAAASDLQNAPPGPREATAPLVAEPVPVPADEGILWQLLESCVGRELLPGFIHYPGILPLGAQQLLLDMACEVAKGRQPAGASGGWYRRTGSRAELNDGTKARFWDSASVFPPDFSKLGEELSSRAGREFSKHLAGPCSAFRVGVGALNYYTPRGRMNWHADDYNFAKAQRPIIMASLGDAADFGYKASSREPEQLVRLNSGDVIVFGGPSRDLVHALLRVHARTAPAGLAFPEPPGVGRVSVTWRDVGPEDGLTFNSDERLGLVVTSQTLPRYLPGRSR